ncbi:MAG: diacylglycerol kinase family protein [Clostridia bacterium]|nr:diacylglycerol kinase family protein [Clostridia bacterium]
MKSLIASFKYAIRGIVYCINNERNMRIHTTAAVFIIAFSFFFPLSVIEYAVLLLVISMVIGAEMINTAIEELTDMSSSTYNPMARISKDVAAGAVFFCAVCAVVIGVIIFWKPEGFLNIYNYFSKQIYMLIPLVIFALIAVLYIFIGPVGIKERVYKMLDKSKDSHI